MPATGIFNATFTMDRLSTKLASDIRILAQRQLDTPIKEILNCEGLERIQSLFGDDEFEDVVSMYVQRSYKIYKMTSKFEFSAYSMEHLMTIFDIIEEISSSISSIQKFEAGTGASSNTREAIRIVFALSKSSKGIKYLLEEPGALRANESLWQKLLRLVK